MDTPAEIRFDNWTLRGEPRELLHDGVRVRLQEQPLQILEELLAHPGQLVTREHLISLLWPKRVVDYDSALNAAVRRLRAALGDEAETPRYIETIPRHGYRFIGALVQPTRTSGSVDAPVTTRVRPRLRLQWVAAAALAVIACIGLLVWVLRHDALVADANHPAPQNATKSIAVLPFVDLSAEQDQQYFADGLTEELISHLAAKLPLRVIARTSSFSFKGANSDIATVARKLGVTHVLEGSVRRSGGQMRITAQLIDAATSSHLWSQSYDRNLDDFLKVQDDIAGSVAGALQVALGEGKPSIVAGDPRVYELVFRARFFFQRRGPGDLERAGEYYEQAVTLDPAFAPAWAGLAGVHWVQTATGAMPYEAGREKVRDAAQRALSLDPGLAEAHIRMANYFSVGGNQDAAAEHWRQAQSLEPNSLLVMTFVANAAAEEGRIDDAIELQRQVVAADPLSAVNRNTLALYLYMAGRFDEAEAQSQQLMEVNPSHSSDTLALMMIMNGKFDAALELIESAPASEARSQNLALVYYAMGRRAESDVAIEELKKVSRDPYLVAEVYAYRGEIDEAFEWLKLDDAVAENDTFRDVAWVKRNSPLMKPLHSDPRWGAWAAAEKQ